MHIEFVTLSVDCITYIISALIRPAFIIIIALGYTDQQD